MNKDTLLNSNHSSLFISLVFLCFYKYCSKSLFYNNTRPVYLNVGSKLTIVLLKKRKGLNQKKPLFYAEHGLIWFV